MKRIGVPLWSFILCGLFTLLLVAAREGKPTGAQGGETSKLVGNWSGESVCVDKEKFPGCHDERVIYRIAVVPDKSDTVTMTMDKIVNGQPETMGVADFVYDAQKRLLTSEFRNSKVHLIVELAVKSDILEGTVAALPDKALVRRIKLKKDE